ncbi:hypothetical protein [Nonomuraea basaltis]|uniref:hypothetical protein n=1 Tax=Nonomuraea basaltis TaxID=2495887 RepID=UPI00110C5DF1|nr:hypothetical protein [Nonomuraea basaltis]TMR93674.1 hypothetical protein EJK15_38170 [Nonomuraea basaltis]
MKRWLTRILMATAVAGAMTVPLASPAYADYDTAVGCIGSIPFVECSTKPGINPHNSAGWVWARIWTTPVCAGWWWLYDSYSGKRVRSGSFTSYGYKNFFIGNLAVRPHTYQLILKVPAGCTIGRAELRNWT